MFIIYTSPVDGYPRAKEVKSYKEAGRIIQALQEMGADPKATTKQDILTAQETALPLIASEDPTRQDAIIPSRKSLCGHQMQEDDEYEIMFL